MEDRKGSGDATFAAHLKRLRRAAGLTQRQVESATGGVVSDGYVSQLEGAYVSAPSPRVLRALATAYDSDYSDLLARAGYDLPPAIPSGPEFTSGRYEALFSSLRPEEVDQVLDFIAYLKSKR